MSCERPSFALQKVAFWLLKDALLQAKRPPLAKQPVALCIKNVNKSIFWRFLFALSAFSNTFVIIKQRKQKL